MTLKSRVVRIGVSAGAALAIWAPALAHAGQASPRVIGGTQVSIQSVPWQVYLLADNPPLACGGVILDATRILTAGHCVVPEGAAGPRPPADITILAGASDVSTFRPGSPPPAGSQSSAAASVRVHPNYVSQPQLADDVAIVTLAKRLDLSGPNAKAIGLAGVGAGPAPGTPLSVSGYGLVDESQPPDGKLRATGLTAISDDDCRASLSVNTSPTALCATSPAATTCHGDSGSALTTADGAPVVVGLVSFVTAPCGIGPPGFTDVSAPEVRAFIDGAAQIPIAPRLSAPAAMRWVLPPVNGSPLTCQPGTWSGAPGVTYTFKTDTASAQVLQSGPSNQYAPRAAQVGQPIVCVVTAFNAGGASTARSATSPPIQRDRVRPRFAVRSARCSRRRTCQVMISAVDPNSFGALHVRVSASYRVGRHTRTRALAVKHISPRRFRATGRHLPRRGLRFAVRVSDAAGNRARTRHARARG